MKADDIFFNVEGNNWYSRNKDAFNIKSDIPLKLIELYNLNPGKVIELGCSNGWRLNEIKNRFGKNIVCAGIDAGEDPIKAGSQMYSGLILKHGKISDIPFEEEFDLVIVNYVLHWVDRTSLLKSIAEIDRVLKDGGYLIIGDFYPDFPQRRKYQHLQENIFTWKMLYNRILISTNLYKEVVFLSNDHDRKSEITTDVEGPSRGFCSLLKKSCEKYYPEV